MTPAPAPAARPEAPKVQRKSRWLMERERAWACLEQSVMRHAAQLVTEQNAAKGKA